MKKNLLIFTMLVAMGTINLTECAWWTKPTEDEMIKKISVANKMFVQKTNIFEKGLERKEVNIWNNMVKDVANFIKINAKEGGAIAPGDEKLLSYLESTKKNSSEFIDTLNRTYKKIFYIENKVKGTGTDRDTFVRELSSIVNTLKIIERNLKLAKPKYEKFYVISEKVKKARIKAIDMLENLILTITTNTNLAIEDIAKEIKKRITER